MALDAVLFDDSLQQELIKKGVEQASKFSWERCANETMEIIESIS